MEDDEVPYDTTSNDSDSVANNENNDSACSEATQQSSERCSRYGRVIRPPKR